MGGFAPPPPREHKHVASRCPAGGGPGWKRGNWHRSEGSLAGIDWCLPTTSPRGLAALAASHKSCGGEHLWSAARSNVDFCDHAGPFATCRNTSRRQKTLWSKLDICHIRLPPHFWGAGGASIMSHHNFASHRFSRISQFLTRTIDMADLKG